MFFHSAELFLLHLKKLSPYQFPALLLLDYHMPGVNGSMLLDLLKDNPLLRHLHVVMYSTELTTALNDALLQKGAMQCFRKVHAYPEVVAFATMLKNPLQRRSNALLIHRCLSLITIGVLRR